MFPNDFGYPIVFSANTADGLLNLAANRLKHAPEYAIRGMKVKELTNVVFHLSNPYQSIIYNPYRKISMKYLAAEWLWYISGNQTPEGSEFISHYAPFWNSVKNEDGSLNSNYGHYMFNTMDQVLPTEEEFKPISDYYFKHSQFDYIVKILTNDKFSRQAVVNINNIYHKAHETKDFPCTLDMQFMIRTDPDDGFDKLCMNVNMRSTDLIFGFCNDIFQFSMFQSVVFHELLKKYPLLRMGYLSLSTNSLHVYERHYKMLDGIVLISDQVFPTDEVKVTSLSHIFDFEYNDFCNYLWGYNTRKAHALHRLIKNDFGCDIAWMYEVAPTYEIEEEN